MDKLKTAIKERSEIPETLLRKLQLQKLADYWKHQNELLKGYEKDPKKLKEYSEVMRGWIKSINDFIQSYCK